MMIKELTAQGSKTVFNFFQQLGHNARTYSKRYADGIPPLLKGCEVYVYANYTEVVILMIDNVVDMPDELADEMSFNGEGPLYFTERSHRPSPVWDLAVTVDLIQCRLNRLSKHVPKVLGVLLTNSNILNIEDMKETWDALNVKVFHQIQALRKLSLTFNEDFCNDLSFPIFFIGNGAYEKQEILQADYRLRKLIEPDYEKPSEEPSQFERLLGLDLDDLDFSEECGFGSTEEDSDFNDAVTANENDYMADNKALHLDSVKLTVITDISVDGISRYTSGHFVVRLQDASVMPDDLECSVYTEDFVPMCSSNDACVEKLTNEKEHIVSISIPCIHVIIPGNYVLLFYSENCHKPLRYDFSLDVDLESSLSEGKACDSFSKEDILVSSFEPDHDGCWKSFASTPGIGEMWNYAITKRQLMVYNEYRSLMQLGEIAYNQNLLICTRHHDLDEQLLAKFRLVLRNREELCYFDCSEFYDSTKPNPYEELGRECREDHHKEIICLTHIGTLLGTAGKVIVKKILELMDRDRHNILWICGSTQEIDQLLSLYPSFAVHFLKTNRIELEPLSAYELVQAFFDGLMNQNLDCLEATTDTMVRAIIEGHSQGVFTAWTQEDVHRWVRDKIVPRYLERCLVSKEADKLLLLTVEDLCLNEITNHTSSFESAMKELNEMVGLNDIKQGIRRMANNARFFLERRHRGLRACDEMVFHSIFTGNPGTGKTTVARMLGKIYHSLGLLSKGEVVYVDRTRIVGQYIGQTEDNMKVILEEARGNVLFIDEAYTLYTGESGEKRDFGNRVIETLLTVLSQPNPDMVVILAGYTKEMDAMLSTNPGLSGRFPYRYLFKDYSEEELMQIANRIFERNEYLLTREAQREMKRCISETVGQKLPNFGNARWVEQFVNNGIVPVMSERIFSTSSDDFQTVEAEDVRKAFEDFCPRSIELKPNSYRKVVGFNT